MHAAYAALTALADAGETRMTTTTDCPAHAEHDTAPRHWACTLRCKRPAGAATLEAMLQHFRLLEPVFDAMPDIVFL